MKQLLIMPDRRFEKLVLHPHELPRDFLVGGLRDGSVQNENTRYGGAASRPASRADGMIERRALKLGEAVGDKPFIPLLRIFKHARPLLFYGRKSHGSAEERRRRKDKSAAIDIEELLGERRGIPDAHGIGIVIFKRYGTGFDIENIFEDRDKSGIALFAFEPL